MKSFLNTLEFVSSIFILNLLYKNRLIAVDILQLYIEKLWFLQLRCDLRNLVVLTYFYFDVIS